MLPAMTDDKLTDILLSTDTQLLKSASEHPFLQRAGEGTLSGDALCAWLVQDKYYQFGYINFIGRLCGNLNLDSYAFPKGENLTWTTFTTLVSALNAIKDEIDFYNDTIEQYDLSLQPSAPNEVTEAYRRLFTEASEPGKPISHGLTVLWATEFVYLKAWSFAKAHMSKKQVEPDSVAALHEAFAPRWTSHEFEQAVQGLSDILNRWFEIEPGEKDDCIKLWTQVLELEIKFWTDI